jgi:uncharacterized protein (UPF0128 family)
MFAIMCFHLPPADAKKLFESHFLAFTDDIARLDKTDQNTCLLRDSKRQVLVLFWVKTIMEEMGHDLHKCGIIIGQADQCALKGLEMEKNGEENPITIRE